MSFLTTLLTIVATAIITALATGLAQYISTRKIDEKRVAQKRHAAGILIQAEVTRFYNALKQHNKLMHGYARRVERGDPSDFPKLETGTTFPVFHALMSDIGLFDHDTASQIVFCYFNCKAFLSEQEAFIRDLPTKSLTTAFAQAAQEFATREAHVMEYIARLVPMATIAGDPFQS